MPIEFQKTSKEMKFLDPGTGFTENSRITEIRTDPLTGQTARILYFPVSMRREKPDLSDLVERSLTMGCPFCPAALENVTPKFPKDVVSHERVRVGDAVIFPNMFPYDTYSAVGIFSGTHFIEISGFSEDLLTDGFLACQSYLREVTAKDPGGTYCSINWNYMPLAGGTIIHPHLQIIAGGTPTNYQLNILEASRRYYEEHSANYWDDLIEKEKEIGERYLSTIGTVAWLMSFVPKGPMDVMALFLGKSSIPELTAEDIRHFSSGLIRVQKFLGDRGFFSFNMAIYSGFAAGDYFWTSVRIVPRLLIPPMNTSDCNYFGILHDEVLTTMRPEDVCTELKSYFQA